MRLADGGIGWGGSIIRDETGLYHLYVAIMSDGCGLGDWQYNSYIVHATAKHPLDEFIYNETVIGVWTHNPTIGKTLSNPSIAIVMPEKNEECEVCMCIAQATKAYKPCPGCSFLFHIGEAKQGKGPRKKCAGGRDQVVSQEMRRLLHVEEDSSTLLQSKRRLMGRWTKGPYGPWTNIYGPGCENPAPAFHSNGTLYMLCSAMYLYRWDDIGNPRSFAFLKELPIHAHLYANATKDDIANLKFEGGFLYFDSEDNFHVIGHLYDMRDSSVAHEDHSRVLPLVSLMAFSSNGYDWHVSHVQPFDSVVTYTNGTKQIMGMYICCFLVQFKHVCDRNNGEASLHLQF